MSHFPAVYRLFQWTLHHVAGLPGMHGIITAQQYGAAAARIFVQPDDKAVSLLSQLNCVNCDTRGIRSNQ
ncbi:hypothetical protein D3C81_1869150 [compost metagenome]